MARLEFTKMHGTGNDYVYVNAAEGLPGDPRVLARRFADRRTGIGGDGLILICPSEVADCRMEMYNADGSRGEMCGNGIRCVAKYAYDRGIARRSPMAIETDAGIRTVELDTRDGRVSEVTVDMGAPVLEGRLIPVDADGRVIARDLAVNGTVYQVTCVSMGNPHCVVFERSVEGLPLDEIGPHFEHHAFFPRRVNTEFVEVLGRDAVRMRVWERGSGETLSCGTGACAVVVAGALTGRTGRRVRVHVRGGDLDVAWDDDDRVRMRGNAVEVFEGTVEV
jgi:diaminopimelate epimerase